MRRTMRPVVKFDAVGYALHVVLGYILVSPHVIDFLLHEFGMGKLGGKITVIGEKEHAGGVAVKASHRIDAFIAGSLDKIHDSEASVGVIAGGHAVLGLVEEDVAFLFECYDLLVIFHHVAVADFGSKFGHDLAVDLDEALEDEFVSFAT